MNKLAQVLAEKQSGPLFMAHMIAGFPSTKMSEEITRALVDSGADIIEMQIPFSDPMADGPTIAVACDEALQNGMTVLKSLGVLKNISKFGKPVAVMSYLNPVFRFGITKFVETIREAGASAVIVPDCPFDTPEGQELLEACEKYDIALIPVVSPGVPSAHLKTIAKHARGFVYCTSRQGITGANSKFANSLFAFVRELKSIFTLPVAVGFGVKSKTDVAALVHHADIVIAGSVFVEAVRKGGSKATGKKMRELR